MIASNVDRGTLEYAAQAVGVRVEIDTLSSTGLRHRVKLLPLVPPAALTAKGRRRRGTAGDAKYQRTSVTDPERRVHAVCWHGFRDFFRVCFARTPSAIFRTSLDTWRGASDFQERFRDSGHVPSGHPLAPVCAAEACRCPESGWAR